MNRPAGLTADAASGGDRGTGAPAESFGDRLAEHVARRESQIVLGLDPDPARLWPRAFELAAGSGEGSDPAARAARAVAIHCSLVIAAAGEQCVAVKLQVACFERLGAAGWAALAEVVESARAAGLLVIADAKRGDVDVTAEAYAQAYFGATTTPYGVVPGLDVDALTVSPLLGADSLMPFVRVAREVGGGLFVLARTSNPGAVDVQERPLAEGGSVSERLARLIATLGAGGTGMAGLSDVGAVVGATAPGAVRRMRELMPAAPFLLPGVGAQGGKVEELAAAFSPGRAAGLIAASRGIVFAHEAGAATPEGPESAARREAGRLRELAWSLSG